MRKRDRLRLFVLERANRRCEYCRIPLRYFQVEHIISRKLGGADEPGNLACACLACNLAKGPLISGLDDGGNDVRLFNPRVETWEDHFEIAGSRIVGLTTTGKVTIQVLRFNSPERVEERA